MTQVGSSINMFKTIFLFLVIATACVAGNPAAGAKEWRWKARHPTVSHNIKALPFKKVIDTYAPSIRIPGTKTVAGCGPVKSFSRIVGGSVATPHSYPWQVALFVDGRSFCGGTIINEEWILTAGHCMDGAHTVEVVAGAHNIRHSEDTQKSIISEEYFVHEQFALYDILRDDIALIRLPESLTWTDAIAPVCLPSRSAAQLATGTLVTPTGWGLPKDFAWGPSAVLRQVTVPVMDTDECVAIYEGAVQDTIICTDSTGGHGVCSGDSGGPMNYVDGGVAYTRGIVSFSDSSGCETGFPSGFTRVLNYLDWIETKTGIAIDD